MAHDQRTAVRCGGDAVQVEVGAEIRGRSSDLERTQVSELTAWTDRHRVQHRSLRVGEPRRVASDHDVVDERAAGRTQLVRRYGVTRFGVVHVRLPGCAARDEEQPRRVVGLHADGHPARRCVDEPLDGALLQVAAEDVPFEQVSGEERGPATHRDAFGGAGAGQHDLRLLGRGCRCSGETRCDGCGENDARKTSSGPGNSTRPADR